MNPINKAQWLAWLEHTGYSPTDFPLAFAIELLTDKNRGYGQDRESLKTFLAGWQAGYWTDRKPSA